MFKKVQSKVDFPAMEEAVLQFWSDEEVFTRTQESRADAPRYVFYEGPPTANGKPHIAHAMPRSMKDLIPRYKTMDGYYVSRKAGWDTHGLPVELEVEKQLGMSGKQDIETYGVREFVEKCRDSVFIYEKEWVKMTERMGFWLDMDKPYVTYHNEYIESVWWSLQQAWKKDLLYKGFKVLPYCPRCGTSLSSHEVAQGYDEVEDPSVFVRFPLRGESNTSFLVWTTTPWTLPSNVGLVVGEKIEYVMVEHHCENLILAKDCLPVLNGEYEVLATLTGKDLLGKKYEPPYDLPSLRGIEAHYVLAGDFVNTTDGTGIVHIAPSFGEDDSRVAHAHDLPAPNPVDSTGSFTEEVTEWAGKFVKDADPEIIEYLRTKGRLYKSEKYLHNYPFCWRCDTPLLYYARSSWFIRMTKLKDQVIANNQTVNWFPDHIKDGRFGNFLDNMVDWAISRERYWGTPLPIWECGCGERHCVGSIAELTEMAVQMPEKLDLHRPYVDDIKLRCPSCEGEMNRVSEVIDGWYDSGSMPFAQWHYPFENKDLFAESFPADYICEAIDQTRGWFYTLLAISTMTFGQAPYKNVLVTELGLDDKGQKMSKSKGNVFDPWKAFTTIGADGLRWFIYSVNPPWYTKRFSMEAMQETQRRVMGTLWNVYSFFALYANIDGFDPGAHAVPVMERALIDRWMLSRLNVKVKEVRAALDVFNSMTATRAIEELIDELSNWYVRRNRRRFWKGEMDQDKVSAYLTLYEMLVSLSRLMAPFAPFIAEELHQNLVRSLSASAPLSVHMESYPVADAAVIDLELNREMDLAREIVYLGRAVRNKANVKVRQPVGKLYFVSPHVKDLRQELLDLVADELNVKEVAAATDATRFVNYTAKPNFKVLGPRYGKEVQSIAKAMAALSEAYLAERFSAQLPLEIELSGENALITPTGIPSAEEFGNPTVSVGPVAISLDISELDVRVQEKEGFSAESTAGLTVVMDLTLTPALLQEGLVREMVSKLQAMRKEAGFEVEDKIVVSYSADNIARAAIAAFEQYIRDEVLAVDISDTLDEGAFVREWDLNGAEVTLAVRKV